MKFYGTTCLRVQKEYLVVDAFLPFFNSLNKRYRFYARKQNASRVFAIVWASVRPSVRHTLELYQNGAS